MTLDMEFELDVPFDMQFGDWLPASPGIQSTVRISADSDDAEGIRLEAEKRTSGKLALQHYSGSFDEGAEYPTILGNIADGEHDNDAATVGQLKAATKGIRRTGENPAEVLSAAYLAEYYEPAFYSTLAGAAADLNAGTTDNADGTVETAVVALYTNSNGDTCLTLLSNIDITAKVEITVPVIFRVNGYTISYSGAYSIALRGDNSVLDCRAGASKLVKVGHTAPILSISGTNFKLLGGYFSYIAPSDVYSIVIVNQSAGSLTIDGAEMYIESTSGERTTACIASCNVDILNSNLTCIAADGYCVCVQNSSTATRFTVNNCMFSAEGFNDTYCVYFAPSAVEYDVRNSVFNAHSAPGLVYGIYALSGTVGKVVKCDVSVSSISGAGCALHNSGTVEAENANFFADGTTGSVSEGNEDYAGTQGILNWGTMTLKDCTIYGIHTGLQCGDGSITKINGGLYEGVGHGGVYVACDNGGQFYAENATFRNATYRGKFKAQFFYGNGQYVVAAVYVGGGNDIKGYFDNCIIDGERAEPIALRVSDGEGNNAVYVSNSTIMGDGKIRFGGLSHTLYTGFCNRILSEANYPERIIDDGRKVYTGYEEFRTL